MKIQLEMIEIDLDDDSLINKWEFPKKQIYSAIDIPLFHKSKAISNINAIISLICEKISLTDVPDNALAVNLVDFDSKITSASSISHCTTFNEPPKFDNKTNDTEKEPITVTLIKIFETIKKLQLETPPFPGPRRYGNLAYRDWHDKLGLHIENIIKNSFQNFFDLQSKELSNFEKNFEGFILEAKYYLLGSFGSRERLDYGTGHELSFIAFLGCLTMSGLINQKKLAGSQWLLILSMYYDFIKSLILTYTLEPAGSHGVWGLDDHFHLIYVFGACQLVDFEKLAIDGSFRNSEPDANVMNFRLGLKPSSILNLDTLRRQRTKNLYYNAISFIKMVKIGPFSEHSPILYEVSASKNWEKVARGMLKMYYGEVLSKFPVVQHFYFGGVFYPWTDSNNKSLPSSNGKTDGTTDAYDNDYIDINSRYIPSVKPSINPSTTTREKGLYHLAHKNRNQRTYRPRE